MKWWDGIDVMFTPFPPFPKNNDPRKAGLPNLCETPSVSCGSHQDTGAIARMKDQRLIQVKPQKEAAKKQKDPLKK